MRQEDRLRYKFDLKGSTHGRRTKGVLTTKTDRKDLDFLDLKKGKNADILKIAKINQHMAEIIYRDVSYL